MEQESVSATDAVTFSGTTQLTKAIVVLNPNAKQFQPDQSKTTITDLFSRYAPQCDFRFIENPDLDGLHHDIHAACQEDPVPDVIIAVGGDGSIREVARVLLDYPHIPLGLLPHGTGNLLARSMGVPPESLEESFQCLVKLHKHTIPIARVNDTVALVAVGLGLDAQVMEETPKPLKKTFGMLAYFWQGLKTLFELEKIRVRLTLTPTPPAFARKSKRHTSSPAKRVKVDSLLVVIKRDALRQAAAFNLPFFQEQAEKEVAQVKPLPGKLEVCLLRLRNRFQLFPVLSKLFFANRLNTEGPLKVFSAQEVRIDAVGKRPLSFQVDGDIHGTTPITIAYQPQGITVFGPCAEDEGSG